MDELKKLKQNEPFSSLSHFLGTILSLVGLILLVVLAAIKGNAWKVVGFSIYGISLVLLYGASALYHFISSENNRKKLFQKFDHALIYVLIAGTYTPICLIVLRGGWGWSIFGIVWSLAIAGILIKFLELKIKSWLSTVLYILMGWVAVVAISPLSKSLPDGGLVWLFTGGLFYTVGTIFFGLERYIPRKRWFGMHEIFHIFVLAGSFCHFWLMLKYVL
ncbi:MAG: Channel protein, hemolysin III family [Candidatus Yanofskybacteria bacterium GW2011_GWF1_44_227]|uniref:Channel protein, hemolysin III family n=1 Tax=Candidatus Yanofskybacteria bacterium GW2011_GWE2_40_11 TaxID=1619033 RepID=A0A0G0TTC4_9BACT|nr:MAG: Channel protein, hemolysin III family [Candidatus Yanofskybacteria bacterium GW2011_GWE1_40_10]KKR41132.1 MAG: Channel protein, hemolysin III family [Candidatus Yanofskybacteria bacterium GW2011_GWE2_40_11]KKT15871.1 MAG: Channel protein, hemolysin III family [Candidatus Yanofskybacteria bacterium GW2011_GWF2_43_596]KKT53616.1 MAG: Channel protein, hemolysin III family [Candidatus Yanofskybacteria bacterium GW2011_GWF1_44_227]OGN36257.1 MAG: hemolysin [Candidatus Yanofskybacteria bacter